MGFFERLVSAAVPLSFGRPGQALRRLGYDSRDLDVDLSDRVAIVTGATSEIGYATAHALAVRGARVMLLARHPERGEMAVAALREDTGSDRIDLAVVDLSRQSDVRAFCAALQTTQVDILIHGAGSVPDEKTLSDDGIELAFATNVVGPCLLTALLIPRLQAAADARVLFVGSGGMYLQKFTLEDWDSSATVYDPVIAFAYAKRAVVILSEMFADRFRGSSVTFNCMHPGWVDTRQVEHNLPTFHALSRAILRSPKDAADTLIWLAVASRLAGETGKFWFDRQARRTHVVGLTRESQSDRDGLWALVSELAGIDGEAITAASQTFR